MKTGIKKKIVLSSICSTLSLGVASFAAMSFARESNARFAVGINEYYSITINAEDVTTNTSLDSGSCVAHTDQLNNPISFYYENIKYEENDGNKYLVFGEDAFFGNDKNSQIRKIDRFTVYGDGGVFSYDFGWGVKAGSIQYSGDDYSGQANGSSISCGVNQPNYIAIMHRENETDVRISKIVFVYSVDCTEGAKPNLESISLSGQTTTFTRGNAFSFGGTVTATYSNGTTADVTALTTFSGYNMSVSGNYTVTASYTKGTITKTATYTITVNKKWTTLWSGNKSLSWNTSSSTTPSDVIIYTNANLPNPCHVRITFTLSDKQGDAGGYCTGATTWSLNSNSKPSSPREYKSFNPTANYSFVGVCSKYDSTYSITCYLVIAWDKTNTRFRLHCGKVGSEGVVMNKTISISCSKIERYY